MLSVCLMMTDLMTMKSILLSVGQLYHVFVKMNLKKIRNEEKGKRREV